MIEQEKLLHVPYEKPYPTPTPTLPYPTLPYSYPTLPYHPTLSYPTLPYPSVYPHLTPSHSPIATPTYVIIVGNGDPFCT